MRTIPITPVYDSVHTTEQAHSGNALNSQQSPIDATSTCASSALVALQILDSSMAPELNLGQVVVIDRTGKLSDGAMVLVETNEQLLIRCWQPVDKIRAALNKAALVPLNPLWKTIYVSPSELEIKGVVVQRNGRRRRDRKRYA